MSIIVFEPKPGTHIDERGWPNEVVGDGFIHMEFWAGRGPDKPAIYRDQFGEEYQMVHMPSGKFVADVRED